MKNKNFIKVVIMAVIWIGIVFSQIYLHVKAVNKVKDRWLLHARDMSRTLSSVIRSQKRFHTVHGDRLKAALHGLISTHDLQGVVLLSETDEVVAGAGKEIPGNIIHDKVGTCLWAEDAVFMVDIISLGEPYKEDAGPENKLLYMDQSQIDKQRKDRDRKHYHELFKKYRAETKANNNKPPPHPPWMERDEYENMLLKQGLHKFVMRLSNAPVLGAQATDRTFRIIVCLVSLPALIGLGLWMISREQAIQLKVNLVQAWEMNRHLRDMNTAAAGLAHETRNPLNRIRGLGQIIAAHKELPEELQGRATLMVEETDRISASLREFIEFSRPLEPEMVKVKIKELITTLERTLEADLQDKQITFNLECDDVTIQADENMLRRMLFNLFLNAIQAMPENGSILVRLRLDGETKSIVVADSGPGIPEEERERVFMPYVTLNEQGSGLGLAIVRQVALAHHWNLTLEDSELGGAAFVIDGIC